MVLSHLKNKNKRLFRLVLVFQLTCDGQRTGVRHFHVTFLIPNGIVWHRGSPGCAISRERERPALFDLLCLYVTVRNKI